MTTRRGRPRNAAARSRIIESATGLFVRRGFVATTVADIAADAGVSVQTIYSAYASKVGVLSAAHDVALAGDDEPVPLAERDWFRALADTPSAGAALGSALDQMCDSTARVAPVYSAMLAAEAEPDIARLMVDMRARRIEFSRLLTDQVFARPGGEPVDRARVADLLYAVESVECYELFVTQRGWSLDQWRRWVYDTVAATLLPTR